MTEREVCWTASRISLHKQSKSTTPTSIRVIDTFAAGNGFQFLLEKPIADINSQTLTSIWPALCEASLTYGHSLTFWHNMHALLEREHENIDLEGSHMENLKRAMILCLASPSHDMRLVVLNILKILRQQTEELRNIVTTAINVEHTPLNLEHQRSVAMYVGQLAKLYPAVCSDEWIGEAIPAYCFGLLHARLASIWNDTCSALKAMCNTKEGEAHVTQIALQWLKSHDSSENTATGAEPVPLQRRYVNEFQCTNLVALQEHFTRAQPDSDQISSQLETAFNEQHTIVPLAQFVLSNSSS